MPEPTDQARDGPPMPPHAIAVIGMAGRFPGAQDLDAFWRNVVGGVECLDTLTDADLDAACVSQAERSHPAYVRRGTFLERCEEFDAGFFGFSPREAQTLDPQHRVFLECAWEAIEHAGYASDALPEAVGVYGGASMNSYLFAQVMRNPALAAAVGNYQLMLGNDKDFLCTRVSYKLGLRGPSMTIQTACSTSLVAVQVACRAIQRGECDMALAGGVSILFPLRAGYRYQEGMILSPDGHCRPFDAQARGTRAGAGAGIVVLKRLDQALADGDTVHAVIRGIAVNNDGAGKAGYTAPGIEGQLEVIATAQAVAGVSARSIGYVEAHGTATPLGDPIEIGALTQAFRADTADLGFCRLGSLKASIGHLDAAAGVAGLIKTVLALEHRQLPPLVNFHSPNPALQLDSSPFHASASAAPWTVPEGGRRRAGVSSFGIGGTNAHAVLEEAPQVQAQPEAIGPQLLVLSARSEAALALARQRLAAHLVASPLQSLADVAYTLQRGRQAFAHRSALVVSRREHAITALCDPQRAGVLTARHDGGVRQVAFLFSGQGSQHAGMGRGLYESDAAYRDALDQCAVRLQSLLGTDIRALIFDASDGTLLNETRFAQPALFACEYALAMLWRARGITPRAMLGHSIGEYVAAHLAGVMSLPDALAVVAARGRLMQLQAPGSMAAVHLGVGEVQRWLEPGIELAALNAPGLSTLSGPTPALQSLVSRLSAAGVEARLLQTSHAFHSAMMEPALAPFVDVLRSVNLAAPTLPYVSNVTGTWITPEQATSPQYYADHLRGAVMFETGLRTLAVDATLQFLEVGPGQALSSLARLTLGADGAHRVIASMRRPSESRPDAEMLLESTGRLWLAGCAVAWQGVHAGTPRRRVPLPSYPFERRRYAVDPTPMAQAGAGAVSGPAATVSLSQGGDGLLPRHTNVDDWFYAPTWSRDDTVAARSAGTTAAGPRWLLLGDEGPLSHALLNEMRQRGMVLLQAQPGDDFQALGPDRWRVRPESKDDWLRLREAMGVTPLDGVMHLWGVGEPASSMRTPEQTYDQLLALSIALAPAPTGPGLRLILASASAESVLGEFIHDARQALATGPMLVLPTELPGLQLRRVDLEGAPPFGPALAQTVAALADEAQLAAPEPQVARRLGQRWVRRFERISLAAPAAEDLPLRKQGSYLITGGLGGMGLALARWLGREFCARLLLTSRQGLPPREAWDEWIEAHGPADQKVTAMLTIRELEANGAEVLVAAADASDAAAMGTALAAARDRFGELNGVIHAAGVAGRGSIAQRSSPEQAREVFAPKVGGLQVLTRLLGKQPLDWVVLFGGINGIIGSPGTCDYAAANAVLDAFVDSDGRPSMWRHVVAIDWGAWRDVGMAARLEVPESLRTQWTAHLAGAIAPDSGIEAFSRVLASRRRRVVVETYDLVHRHEMSRRPAAILAIGVAEVVAVNAASARLDQTETATPPTAPFAPEANSRPSLSTPFVAPSTPLEKRLAAIWEELLGVSGIGVQDDFFELGGHSLMFTRVLSRIDESFGTSMPLEDAFDAPTIQALARRMPFESARIGDSVRGTEGLKVIES